MPGWRSPIGANDDLGTVLLRLRMVRGCLAAEQRRRAWDFTPTPTNCSGQDGADVISTAEAAGLLGLSRRSVQRLAASGIGIRLGRSIWALDRSTVLALARQREADR